MRKLRIGVILSDVNVPVWVARMLEQIRDSSNAKIIVLAFIGHPKIDNFVDRLPELRLQLDNAFMDSNPSPWEQCDVRTVIPNAPLLNGDPHTWNLLLKTADLDIFLNLSQDNLDESLIHAAHYGIWSLRSNNKRVTTSTVPSWLGLKRHGPVIHCVVEAQRGLSVQVVASAVLPANCFSFMKDQKTLLWKASSLVPEAIKQLYLNGESKFFAYSELTLN